MTVVTKRNSQILAMGLPRAGKTTFLAALWHVLQSEQVPNALRLSKLSGDAKYLNSICSDWRQFREIPKTLQQSEQITKMWLSDGNGRELELVFPDLSGETFLDQWTGRAWTPQFDELASGSEALILFVHPNQIIEPIEIYTASQLLGAEELEPEEDSTKPSEASEDNVAAAANPGNEGSLSLWDPKQAAAQVQVVDLMQLFLDRVQRSMRIAIVVSAWDLLKNTKYKLPSDYLREKVTFLFQFLDSNPEILTYKVFGVSAIGANLEEAAEVESLKEIDTAAHRIQVTTDATTCHDITEPMRWALNWYAP
jgi:GTPase SAR1 family protein